MERKNTFQIVEENYNIGSELLKLYKLFLNGSYFNQHGRDHTFKELLDQVLLKTWDFRGTCLDTDEYLQKSKADYFNNRNENCAINFLEVIENWCQLLFSNKGYLYNRYNITINEDFSIIFYNIVLTLESRMGLAKQNIKNQFVLYPENAPLEQVVKIVDNEHAQWELIKYARESMHVEEKRKSLAYFATQFYIEQDDEEGNPHIKPIMKDTTNILNSIQIRHNNETGKWEKNYIKDITDTEASALCDMAFNNILAIVLLREQKKYKDIYKAFRDKQKQDKKKEN